LRFAGLRLQAGDEFDEVGMASGDIYFLFVLASDAIAIPEKFEKVAIVSASIAGEEGFVRLFDEQEVADGAAIEREADMFRELGGNAREAISLYVESLEARGLPVPPSDEVVTSVEVDVHSPVLSI